MPGADEKEPGGSGLQEREDPRREDRNPCNRRDQGRSCRARGFDVDSLAGPKDRPRPGRPPKLELEGVRNAAGGRGGATTARDPRNCTRERPKRDTAQQTSERRCTGLACPWGDPGGGVTAGPIRAGPDGGGNGTQRGGFHARGGRGLSPPSLVGPYSSTVWKTAQGIGREMGCPP